MLNEIRNKFLSKGNSSVLDHNGNFRHQYVDFLQLELIKVIRVKNNLSKLLNKYQGKSRNTIKIIPISVGTLKDWGVWKKYINAYNITPLFSALMFDEEIVEITVEELKGWM